MISRPRTQFTRYGHLSIQIVYSKSRKEVISIPQFQCFFLKSVMQCGNHFLAGSPVNGATFYQVAFCFCPSLSRETLMRTHVVRTHSCPAGYGVESSRWKLLHPLGRFCIMQMQLTITSMSIHVNSTFAFWLNMKGPE